MRSDDSIKIYDDENDHKSNDPCWKLLVVNSFQSAARHCQKLRWANWGGLSDSFVANTAGRWHVGKAIWQPCWNLNVLLLSWRSPFLSWNCQNLNQNSFNAFHHVLLQGWFVLCRSSFAKKSIPICTGVKGDMQSSEAKILHAGVGFEGEVIENQWEGTDQSPQRITCSAGD